MKNLSIMAKACDENRPKCSAVFYNASRNEFMSTDGRVFKDKKQADGVAKSLNTDAIPVLVED